MTFKPCFSLEEQDNISINTKKIKKTINKNIYTAIKEDKNIYEYDKIYDNFKINTETIIDKNNDYIENFKNILEKRKLDNILLDQKKLKNKKEYDEDKVFYGKEYSIFLEKNMIKYDKKDNNKISIKITQYDKNDKIKNAKEKLLLRKIDN